MNIISSDIPTQILLTILLSIDRIFNVLIESLHNNSHQKETIYDKLMFLAKLVRRRKSEQNLSKNVYYKYSFTPVQNWKSLVKNEEFECRYIRTQTKKKPSKISDITFAILPFYKKTYSNWTAIVITLEPTTLDETIRCALKWFT